MSNRIIDEQVVKMEFDNSKFEQNAEASLRTIDKLKNALKFENADKGFSELENAANKINLGKLESNIQAISDRFSTMGIIGASVINSLTNNVMGLVGKIGNLLASPMKQIIEGGKARAMNIANAEFSLKGQGIDWKKESEEFIVSLKNMTAEEKSALDQSGKFVDSLYKDIDYAVSGTAYGLDSAAKAAAQLSASNVQIGDEMRQALRGISGVAAMTNSSYDEIANIFTHIAGKNKVQLSELNMISMRGLGVQAELAKALGVTEAEISDMVSKGKIDFKTFAEAMDNAFGEHAKEANNTFNGAMSNVKSALSRIGADNASTFYDQMIKPLNDLRKIINNINVALGPVKETIDVLIKSASSGIQQLLKMTGLVTDQKLTIAQMPRLSAVVKNLQQSFLNLMLAVANVIKPIRLALVDVFQPTADIFVDLSYKIREFTEGLIINKNTQNSIYKIATAIFKLLKTGFKVIGKVVEIVFKLADALSPLLLGVVDFIGFLADLISFLIDVADAMGIFDMAIEAVSTVILTAVDIILTLIGAIGQGIMMFANWIAQTGILDTAITGITKVIDFLTEVVLAAVDGVISFFTTFGENNDIIKGCGEVLEGFVKIITNLFNPALDEQGNKIEGAITSGNAYLDAFNLIVKGIEAGFGAIKGAIDKFYEGSEPIGAAIIRAIEGFNLKSILDAFAEITDWINNIDLSVDGVGNAFEEMYNNLCKAFGLDGSIPWENLKKIFMGGLFFQLFGAITETTKVVSGLGHRIDTLLKWSVEWLKADAFRKRVAAFETICKGVLMLAGALFVIAAIREDRLLPAVAAISVITFVAVALMQAIKYMDKRMLPAVLGGAGAIDKIIANIKYIADALATSISVAGLGAAIFMFTAAVWLLAGAFITWYNIFSNDALDPTAVAQTILMIAGLLAAFTTMGVLLGKAVRWSGGGFLALTVFIGAIVVAVYALMGAVLLFNSIPWGEYIQGIVWVAAALGALVAVVVAISVLNRIGSKIPGSGLGGAGAVIIGIAAYLLIVVYAIEKLTQMRAEAVIGAFIAILFILAAAVAAIIIVTNGVKLGKLTSMIGLAFVIMAVAYAIENIVGTMQKLAKMKPAEAILSLIEIIALLIFFGGSIAAVGFSKATAGPFLGMAVMLIVICSALAWIALLNWPDILKGVFTLGTCMVLVGTAMYLAGNLSMDKFVALGFSAIILAIAGALWIIAKLPFFGILKAMYALITTMTICSIVMGMMSGFSANGAAVIAFAGVIAALGLALGLIAHFDDMDRVLVTAFAMSMVIVAVGGAIAWVEKYGSNPIALSAVGAMVGIIIAIGFAIGVLAAVTDTDKALKAAGALTLVMLAVTVLFIAISKFSSPNAQNISSYAVPLIVALGVLLILTAVLEHLVENMNVGDFNKAQEKILLIAEFVGMFAILTVIFTAIIAICGQLGQALTGALEGFAIVVAVVAALIFYFAEVTFIIGLLADIIEDEFGYDIIAAFERGMEVWTILSAQVGKTLGAIIGGFYSTLSKYLGEGNGELNQTDTYVQLLGSILKKISQGLMDAVTYFIDNVDETRLEDFAEAVNNSIEAIKPAMKTLAEFGKNSLDIMRATAAVGELVAVMSAIAAVKENAIGYFLSGGSHFKYTTQALKNMAAALGEFSDELQNHTFDSSNIDSAITLAKGLKDINTALITSGVLKAISEKIGSVQDIENFGEKIKAFAQCLVEFGGKISGNGYAYKEDKINTFMSWGEKLQTLQSKLPSITAWDNIWGDVQDIQTFGEKLKAFATSLVEFAAILSAGYLDDTSAIDTAITYTGKLIDLQERLPEDPGAGGIFFGSEGNAFTNFGSNLQSFAGALKELGELADQVNYASVGRALRQAEAIFDFFKQISESGTAKKDVEDYASALRDLGNVSFDAFIEAWTGTETKERMTSAIENMMSYINTMDNSKNLDQMYKVGQNFAKKLVDGMKSEKAEKSIVDGISAVIKAITKAMKDDESAQKKYHDLGKAILNSIADGFEQEGATKKLEDGLKTTVTTTGKNAIDSIVTELNEIGEKIAGYIADGIKDANSISKIATAMREAVEEAAAGLSATISVDVQANAQVTSVDGEVLGENYAPDFESYLKTAKVQDERGNVYVNGVKANYQKLANAHKTGYGLVCNSITTSANQIVSAEDKAAKKAQKQEEIIARQKARETQKLSDQYDASIKSNITNKVENFKNWYGDIIPKPWKDAVDKTVDAGTNAVIDGSKRLPTSIKGAVTDKDSKETSNAFMRALGLEGLKEDLEAKTEEGKEAMEKAGKSIGDAAAKAGKSAGSGAKSGGDSFAASYSEFWQNLYLVNHQGINAFEQQFETFEQWQENTLKKTQEIIDNYKNAVVDAKKKAAEGLFSEVAEPKEDVTKEKLKKNLQDQVNQIKEFNNIMLQLRTRLMGTNLFDAITEMGVDSIDELRALNSMTDQELSEYASLYDQKYLASFQTIQQKAQSELQNLYGGMQINIDQFAATFDGSLGSIETYFAGQADKIKAAGASVSSYITQGLAEGATDDAAKDAIATSADEIINEDVNAIRERAIIESPAQDPEIQDSGSYVTQGLAQGMVNEAALQALTDAAESIMAHLVEALNMANENQEGGSAGYLVGQRFTESLANALTNFESIATQFRGKGGELMTAFVEGFKSQQSIAQANINIVLTEIANNIKGIANVTKFKTAGTELFKALMKGFESGWTGAGEKGGGEGEKSYGKTVIEKVMKGIFKLLRDYKGGADSKTKGHTFYWIGQQFIQGLIKGLESKEGELYAAVERIVKEAIARAEAAAAVASPSKKTAEIGRYIGEGFIVGLESMSEAVAVASESVSEEALSGFRDISQVLGGLEDFDASPVIAPVMDLTGIQNGVSEMGNMLDQNSSYEMAASINGGLDAQRTAKLNEMTNLRRAMDSVYNSNTARTNEMAQLQAAVANLNSSINNQTAPDYAPLQSAIAGLNATMSGAQTGTTFNMSPVFNITSNDPEAVAEEVNTALQKMIDRRSAVWA